MFGNTSSAVADQFDWQFGDGGSSVMKYPMYTFTQAGVFSITMTATNTVDNANDMIVLTNAILVDTSENCGLGIDDKPASISAIYPNPTTNIIVVETEYEKGEVYCIQIIDLQGREVFKRITIRPIERINLNQMASGTYMLQVLDSHQAIIEVRKIIKQ